MNEHESMPMPTPTPPGSMYNNSMNMDDMTMHMAFFWGKDVVVLFNRWPNGRLGMYILALAFVFFLASTVEVLAAAMTLKRVRKSPLSGGLILAAVHAVRMGLAYLVMLSVMSFNVGIFISAVAGHAFGCFIVKYRAISAASPSEDDTPTF